LSHIAPTGLSPSRDGDVGIITHIFARRIGVELGPLLAFFVAFYVWDILIATGVFMAATAIAVAASLSAERRMPVVPLLSLALVLAFGGVTLITDDPRFIMIRPTIVNGVYGGVLLMSLSLTQPLLERLLSPGLRLSEEGWRKLTLRLGLFFLLQAALNEIVWRALGVDVWVVFKTFVTIPLNILFALSQIPLVRSERTKAQTNG
jgi:intracellular septation protein